MAYCYYDIMKNKIKNNEIKKEEIDIVYRLIELGINPIPILKDNNNGRYKIQLSNGNNFFSCLPNDKCTNHSNNNNKEIDELLNEKKYIEYYSKKDFICVDKENQMFKICGTNNGNLFIFDKRNDNKIYKLIHDHSKKLIDIFINEELNLFADI